MRRLSAAPSLVARRRARRLLPLGALVLVVAGCGGRQNTLEPKSHAAKDIAHLFWYMLGGSGIGFLLIVVLLFVGYLRRGRAGIPGIGGDRAGWITVLVGGVALPIVVLSILFVISDIFVLKATSAPNKGTTSRTVLVIGKQWYWEAHYPGTKAVTDDEIHIPSGTRVKLEVRTADVIHSFWVPELNRKIDVIPGQTNSILLDATKPGVYRGQCAEFCGVQHAHMAFRIYAQPPAQFRAWLAHEAQPRRAPSTALERRGEQTFLSLACSACHTIRGTGATGLIGPDLTHLASRHTLAGLVIPNRKGYLGGWILDPQHIKPGNRMPGLNLKGPQFQAILAYLDSLE